MSITFEIEKLINFGIKYELITEQDKVYLRNQLLDLLNLTEPCQAIDDISIDDVKYPSQILDKILNYCTINNIIEDTITERDLFSAKIMGLFVDKPSNIRNNFYNIYNQDKKQATDYFYNLSKNSNYIQMERVDKNLYWLAETKYGLLEITVNLSKPEKDPKEIERAKLLPQNNYPKCLLCKENVGFAGNINHPPRQNLRIIDLELNNRKWFLQYSPYIYYNEHCIILDSEHTPMEITKKSFVNLLDFLDFLPHYFIGSNTDIPIVGGSILTHDHYQGGNHVFPMEVAKPFAHFKIQGKDTNVSLVNWPMSVIRISDKDKNILIDVATDILNKWKSYEDISADIIPYTEDIRHNAVTPIGRKNKDGLYELDLVLRNNRTTKQFPMGIFHPHEELHHIKKENIGLIEVLGLAILPGRLKDELDEIIDILSGNAFVCSNDINNKNSPMHKHLDWISTLIDKYDINNSLDEATNIVQREVGNIFLNVLEDAGVFKQTEEGHRYFDRFMNFLGYEKK